jgi:hypothetical protein
MSDGREESAELSTEAGVSEGGPEREAFLVIWGVSTIRRVWEGIL